VTEITKYQPEVTAIANFEESAMSLDHVLLQVRKIQEIQKNIMHEGEHFGKIPGCGDKPTLLKPGAEKLGLVFRLAPEFEVEQTEYEGGHREYRVTCRLRHINSGTIVGEEVGTCTTLESRYRYRTENTGKPVPKEYWDSPNSDLLGGPTFKPRKVDKSWFIYQTVEHENPSDYYNTCLKMGKKRAHVDAILTATAASDIFTQDIEDLPEPVTVVKEAPKTDAAPRKLNEAEITKFWTKISNARLSNTQVHAWLKEKFNLTSIKDVLARDIDFVLEAALKELKPTPKAEVVEAELYEEGDEAPAPDKHDPATCDCATVPIGKDKGKKLCQLDDDKLDWFIKLYQGKIENPEDAKYKANNERFLSYLNGEKERRG